MDVKVRMSDSRVYRRCLSKTQEGADACLGPGWVFRRDDKGTDHPNDFAFWIETGDLIVMDEKRRVK